MSAGRAEVALNAHVRGSWHIEDKGGFGSKGANCEGVAWAGATGQGPQDAGGSGRKAVLTQQPR